jgi:hypothetical protein
MSVTAEPRLCAIFEDWQTMYGIITGDAVTDEAEVDHSK